MASWLELICNIIGYGGFVILASRHPRCLSDDAAHGHEGDGAGGGPSLGRRDYLAP